MGWLIAALVVGAAASAGSKVLANANERQENREKAEYEKQQNELAKQALEAQRKSALGQLDLELAASKEADFAQATAIQRGASEQFTQSMQNTYMSQLAAESQHMDLMSNAAQEMGQLNATMGTSGARQDTTLSQVMAAEERRKISESRATIDTARDQAIAAGSMNVLEATTRANELRSKYDTGSAYMDLYNFKRQSIETASDIDLQKLVTQGTYLDQQIKENKYNWTWFAADAFSVLGAATGGVSSAGALGLIA